MSMNGIDIASYQKSMDVSKVDADFVIIKLTQGDYYINSSFAIQFEQARRSGKLIGLYHYSNGVEPVTTEVNFLINAARPYLGQCIVCLDWESNGNTKQSGYNPVFRSSREVEYVRQFMEDFHNKTGIWPLLYTSASVTRAKNWAPVAANSMLWVAQYANDRLTGYQEKPWRDNKGTGAWTKVAIHQYSPSGTIKGYEQTATHKLDMDISYLTKEEWMVLANGFSSPGVQKHVTPELIIDILNNKYGTGAIRKENLVKNGYNYSEVQKKINEVVEYSDRINAVKKNSGEYWNAVLKLVK